MNISIAIQNAAEYLESTQLSSGGFESTSLPTRYAKVGVQHYRTTFFPSLILSALNNTELEPLNSVKQRITEFLLGQKSNKWSFNYWDRQSREYTAQPYPDDLDDTFCALSALHCSQPGLFTPAVMATIAKLLIATESQEGGPYQTWLTSLPDQIWHDVDIVVNANVGYFLWQQRVELPSINQLINNAILGNALHSPYYPNVFPVIYFIARWYSGGQKQLLTRKLLGFRKGQAWRHPQRTAMAITSLLKLDYDVDTLKPAIEFLLHIQRPDGGWESEAFCVDPSIDSKTHYGSSRALSTALCIEALSLYRSKLKTRQQRLIKLPKRLGYVDDVIAVVDAQIAGIERDELRSSLQEIRNDITTHDTSAEIIRLPQLVAKAFRVEVSPSIISGLAIASLWGWMAYTTYDDFLDSECEARFLPAANVCLRNLVTQLSATLPASEAFHKEVDAILNRLDAANAWEMVHCRGRVNGGVLDIKQMPDYGDYWQLADRSLGHTISALGVLYAAGLTAQAPAMVALRDFMFHYLIARQLNDDAHDWYDDLINGHVNAVGASLLTSLNSSIANNRLRINLLSDKSELQQLMWGWAIDQVCDDITYHTGQARIAFRNVGLDAELSVLDKLLEPVERASKRALKKRDEAREFIAAL